MRISAAARSRVRRLLLSGLKRAGLLSAVLKGRWRQQRLLILCYHGVSLTDEHQWNPDLYFAPEVLSSRFSSLRASGCNVLPLSEALRLLSNRALPPASVSLTFDDGGADFPARALSLLGEYGYPATVYLTTFYCGRPEPVFTVGCDYLAWRGRKSSVDLADVIGAPSKRLDLALEQDRRTLTTAVMSYADERRLNADQRAQLLRHLAQSVRVDFEQLCRDRTLQIMGPNEVRAVYEAGISVELHTHRHRTPDDRSLFEKEISDNRAVIEKLTGYRPVHFCYPSGVCKAKFLPWLSGCGVQSATTCWPQLVSRDSDWLALPRFVDTGSVADIEFEGWLAGVSAIFPTLRRFLGVAPRPL
jgi:peptidoglycan/xylan/chitin deacetylase (PgdA/CDA1 family)